MQPALYFYFEANLIVRSVIKHCAIFMVDLFSDFSCHAGFFFFMPGFLNIFFPLSPGKHVVFYFAGSSLLLVVFPSHG